ncbi:MAG: O-acetylhomoserine aminocarboxypropyltransferase/cysteine synthase [Candidatus Methanomethylophilus sp.]|nr:O-acetylhomoserine aminocarboxypropyltransferase/cysteine synthase [Methanomethylophilus sp.]
MTAKQAAQEVGRIADKRDVPTGRYNQNNYRFETVQVHAGQEEPDPATGARAVPIYLSTSYVFKNCKDAADRFALKKPGDIYGRLTNDTQAAFEQRIAALEGGTGALAVASGAAAVTYAVTALARSGDHIVSASNVYGGTFNLFEHTFPEHYGIKTTWVDPIDPQNFEKAIQPNTKLLYAETFGNPNADITDVEAIAEIAHRHHLPLVIDNTFGTPYLFRPLEHGADIDVESATKFIGGHGIVLGGIIVENGKFDWIGAKKFPQFSEPDPSYHGLIFAKDTAPAPVTTWIRAIMLRDTGACISPVNAFALLVSLETLSLRVDRQVSNALQIVRYLSKHPKVASVSHPSLPDNPTHMLYEKYFPYGGGSIFTFDVKGTKADAQKFSESLKLFSLLANVADVKSLVIHPASTTHSQLSDAELSAVHINPTTIRLSIGTENINDLIADLDQAFAKL